jgi:hypothetical protein
MTDKDLGKAVDELQQLLDRDYAHREWRVLFSPSPPGDKAHEPAITIHARTRDFRYRCRVSRPWSLVQRAPSLRLLAAEVAAEAEQQLADQTATTP